MQLDNRGSISSTLLESVRARRPEAWRRLIDLYGQVVYRWCRKSGLKPEDAADAVQDVFAAVASHVDDFHRRQPGDSFTAWLSTITRNKICDYFRRSEGRPQARGGSTARQIMQEIPQPESSEGDHSLADLIEAENIISRRAVELVRTEFEQHTWDAWYKTAVEGRVAADVAAEMDMSLAAVYKAKSRVLLRLRQVLAGLQD